MSRAIVLREIAERLLVIAGEEEGIASSADTSSQYLILGAASGAAKGDPVFLGRLAETLTGLRRLRKSHFDQDLFAEPAWDILLDLYAQRARGRRVDVTSVCHASGVPQTTALRWLTLLEERNSITRAHDPSDGRRVFVGLSGHGEAIIAKYLLAASGRMRSSRPVFMLIDDEIS